DRGRRLPGRRLRRAPVARSGRRPRGQARGHAPKFGSRRRPRLFAARAPGPGGERRGARRSLPPRAAPRAGGGARRGRIPRARDRRSRDRRRARSPAHHLLRSRCAARPRRRGVRARPQGGGRRPGGARVVRAERAADGSLILGEHAFDDPQALSQELAEAGLHLDPFEIRLARERFGRALRWAELVCLHILWSEHCSYKSTRPLLGRLPTQAPQVILGPGEDAGVVTLGEHEGKRYAAVIGHESHNHPSQVVPYEGAATGVGGIVRDVACMGASVVGTLDGLRFGTGSKKGGARTREIVREVVQGIADYGNALGVPNLGGDVQFDEGFDANCLVNVVAVGVVEADQVVRSRVPSDGDWAFVLAGKPTDASGFGGASFASTVLSDEESERRGAVQLADPFLLRVLTVPNQAL